MGFETILYLVAAAYLGANLFGYIRLIFAKSATGLLHNHVHFAVALLLVAAIRFVFWDVTSEFFTYNEWRSFIAKVGKDSVNGVLAVITIYGGHKGLVAMHLMVPEEDREKWPWYCAWWYPPMGLGGGLRKALRFRWRKSNETD